MTHKLHHYRFMLALTGLFFSTMALAGNWFSQTKGKDALKEAHKAFLKDDYATMTVRLKNVLETSDEDAKQNALQLLEKAYEARGGNVPADWKLPSEISRLTFFLRRQRTPDGDTFGVKLMGTASQKGVIKQLQVVQYPSRTILDKENGIGSWEEEVDLGNGPEFQLQALRQPDPVSDGLYLLNLELANGKSTHGWFIVSNLLSSDTPNVSVPAAGQTFMTPNPTLKWEDFHSPEYKSFERRSLWLATWGSTHWETYLDDPSLTEITVGKSLADGQYSFLVGYREIRRFGDLRLARQSFSGVPFYVKSH